VGRASQRFDRQLYTEKLKELSDKMQAKSMASERKAGVAARKTGGSFLLNIVDGQLALLNEWWEKVDRVAREVWEIQREPLAPEFVRDVLLPEAMNLIDVRKGAVTASLSLAALRRLDAVNLHRAQHHLAMELNRLKAKVVNHYEIEARELEYKSTRQPDPTVSRPPNNEKSGRSEDLESTNLALSNSREALIRPILEEKGFSVHDWATKAKVDFHTANNYLKGKTKPQPSTLKKLADALGVEVAKLPK
jgi:ribosome-binding protein aMBF1 (putative translation factor)